MKIAWSKFGLFFPVLDLLLSKFSFFFEHFLLEEIGFIFGLEHNDDDDEESDSNDKKKRGGKKGGAQVGAINEMYQKYKKY